MPDNFCVAALMLFAPLVTGIRPFLIAILEIADCADEGFYWFHHLSHSFPAAEITADFSSVLEAWLLCFPDGCFQNPEGLVDLLFLENIRRNNAN